MGRGDHRNDHVAQVLIGLEGVGEEPGLTFLSVEIRSEEIDGDRVRLLERIRINCVGDLRLGADDEALAELWRVLQEIRAEVAVGRVVGGCAVGAKVDGEPAVLEEAVTGQVVRGATRHLHAGAVEGDSICIARQKAAHGIGTG